MWLIQIIIIFSSIIEYSTASTADAAYIIGGRDTMNIIAQYKNDSWRRIGTLAKRRKLSGAIALEDEIMVIGGYDPFDRR